MRRFVVLYALSMVASSVMAGTGMSLQTPSGGHSIDVPIGSVPTTIQAEIWSTGSIPGVLLLGYDLDLKSFGDASPWHFGVMAWADTDYGWMPGTGQIYTGPPELLDPSTRDPGDNTTGGQIASIDSTGLGIAWGGGLAHITIYISSGIPQGTYTIGFDMSQGWTYFSGDDWSMYVPDTTDPLTINITPEPASALLLLAGLPFLRRRPGHA